MTLREASDATGIPINTLRKWCRHESVESYLESDGGLTLRMVEMATIQRHAEDLGRDTTPHVENRTDEVAAPTVPDTMIVPIDAWNKMLTQLGNLHEAGQQLADARERAAKAETEAKFLRERLADLRDTSVAATPPSRPPAAETRPAPPIEKHKDVQEQSDDAAEQPTGETTSFFRYVVRGWKGRKR